MASLLPRRAITLVGGLLVTVLLLSALPSHRQRVTQLAADSADALRYRLYPRPALDDSSRWSDHRDRPDRTRPSTPVMLEDDDGTAASDEPRIVVPAREAAGSEYRAHLEAEHGGASGFPPGTERTLGFSHIYVLSLPKRTDRRERMRKLAKALAVDLTFVDATAKDAGVIGWIGERAAEVRTMKRPILSAAFNVSKNHVGGMKIGTMWLESALPEHVGTTSPDDPIHPSTPLQIKQMPVFPSLAADERWGGRDWVDHLEHTPASELRPSDPAFNVTDAMWDRLERNPFRQINDAVIATWYSQTRVWELMRANGDESALVLEDDVDVEWDIARMWPNMRRHLPTEADGTPAWDITFLGHCWGREASLPVHNHPLLHPSSEPRCLHGYALTRRGYARLTEHMRDPWAAYQAAVDTAIPRLIRFGKIVSYSVDPSIIIQSKELPSDIQTGIGSPWRGSLSDSTMERIWRDEGLEVPEPTDEEAASDPASQNYRVTEQMAREQRKAAKVAAQLEEAEAAQLAADIAREDEARRPSS